MRFELRISTVILLALALGAVAACDEEEGKHECEIGRGEGAGYPSPCVPENGCDDGSICGAISPTHEVGICAKPCESDDDCAVDLPCTAVGRCILEIGSSGEMLCAYVCEVEADCPLNMTCSGYSNLNLCYPAL